MSDQPREAAPLTAHVHDQRFDGDDPYLTCRCGALWDALTGRPLNARASQPAPADPEDVTARTARTHPEWPAPAGVRDPDYSAIYGDLPPALICGVPVLRCLMEPGHPGGHWNPDGPVPDVLAGVERREPVGAVPGQGVVTGPSGVRMAEPADLATALRQVSDNAPNVAVRDAADGLIAALDRFYPAVLRSTPAIDVERLRQAAQQMVDWHDLKGSEYRAKYAGRPYLAIDVLRAALAAQPDPQEPREDAG